MTGRRLLALAGLCVAMTASTSAASELPPAAQSPAAATLAQCLQTHDRLSVLVLVDQSGSLDETDPENLRVGGLGAALLGLKRLAERLGSRSKVEVLIAGFYYEVVTYPRGEEPPPWAEIDDRSIEGLLDEVRRFDDLDRHKGRDTDYAAALLKTRELFRQRTVELTGDGHDEPCKALIWFTDGQYQVKPRPPDDPLSARLPDTTSYAPHLRLDRKDVRQDRDGNAVDVERFGKHLLCDARKTMDDLVRDGVVKFTVALSDASKKTNLTQVDKDFLRALTTGSGGPGCGSLLSPQTGQYFDASDSGELLFVLSSLTEPRPDDDKGPICPMDPCPEGLKRLPLVDGLGRFVITADTRSDGVELVLVDPRRGEVRLRPRDPIRLTHSGARLTQWWISPRQVVIEGVLPTGDPRWHGTWHLAFVHPPDRRTDTAEYNVQLIADLVPELVGQPQLTRGESAAVRFRLMRRDGRPSATNPLAATAGVTASVTDGTGQRSEPVAPSGPDERGTYSAEVRAPDSTAPTADLEVRVDFEEKSTIAPVLESFPLRVRLPKSYPLVSPDRLELNSISGDTGTTSGTLTITAAKSSAGCAWITKPETHAPKDAGEIAVTVDDQATSQATCLRVKPGEARELRVTFDPASRADGSVQSVLPVHVRSKASPKDEVTSVPVSFELYPTNTGETIVRTVLLMLAGTLLPLMILHVLNLIAARFPPEHRVKCLAQDATFMPGRSFANPPDTDFGQFEWLSLETGSRKRALGVDELKLHTVASGSWTDRRLRLFSGPYGVVTADDRVIAAGSSVALKELRGGRAHEVPLGLAGTWVFVISEVHPNDDVTGAPGPKAVDGRLVLLIAADGGIDQGKLLERVASAALATWQWPAADQEPAEPRPPSRLHRLRERVPRQAPDEPSDSSWLDGGGDSTYSTRR